MAVQDSVVMDLLKSLANQYNENVNTRFLRQKISNLPVDGRALSMINSLADHPEDYSYRGMMLEELYDYIYAFGVFISGCEEYVVPNLKDYLRNSGEILRKSGSNNPHEKIIMEMAINNFPHNLQVLKDITVKLYRRVVQLDVDSHRVKPPVITRRLEVRTMLEKMGAGAPPEA